MDRQISKEVKKKEQRKQIVKFSVIGIVVAAAILFAVSQLQTTLNQKDITFSVVDRGTIEVSVSASGKVVPAFEEIINTPIESRILEVYKKGGDAVEVGTPILKLDLQSAETEYNKQLDEEKMKEYLLEQKKVESAGKLSDIKMKMDVSQMRMNRLLAEYENGQYLDSLDAGTADKVREAELAYNVGRLEYEQYRQEYANTKEITAADFGAIRNELDNRLARYNSSLKEYKLVLYDQPDTQLEWKIKGAGAIGPDKTTTIVRYVLIIVLLLLVPALNLSSMTLSRMRKRMAEIGVRKAFGATRGELLLQILSENMFLTLLGGVAGLAISYVAVYLMRTWLLGNSSVFITSVFGGTPSLSMAELFNPVIFAYAFLFCLVLNLLSAGIPALRISGRKIVDSLNEN